MIDKKMIKEKEILDTNGNIIGYLYCEFQLIEIWIENKE